MKEVFHGLFVVCVFSIVSVASASTLYIEPHEAEISPGDTIALEVRIDTEEGECINAVDGIIEYPENIVPVDIALGNSIFPVWVETPTIDRSNRRITFAGGIPNGYCGRIEGDPRLTNTILELIIQTPGRGDNNPDINPLAHILFSNQTVVYLNDGAGTQSVLRTLGSSIVVHQEPGDVLIDQWNARVAEDSTPPGKFSIALSGGESAFGGDYFISFNTTDKQSGIDHYEVIEESFDQVKLFTWGAIDAPWIVSQSPYLLRDQSLNSTIRVKAVDKAGNEYIAILTPEESMRGMSDIKILGVVLFIIFVLIGGGAYLLYRRKVRSYRQSDTLESNDVQHTNDQDNSYEE
jgi:hypothetical protein